MFGNTLPAMAMVSAMARGTVNLAEESAMFHIMVMDHLGQRHRRAAEEKSQNDQKGRAAAWSYSHHNSHHGLIFMDYWHQTSLLHGVKNGAIHDHQQAVLSLA